MSASPSGGSAVMPYGSRWSSCRSPKSTHQTQAPSPSAWRCLQELAGIAKDMACTTNILPLPFCSTRTLACHTLRTQPIHVVPNPLQIFKVLLVVCPNYSSLAQGNGSWLLMLASLLLSQGIQRVACLVFIHVPAQGQLINAEWQNLQTSTCQPKCWPVHFGSITIVLMGSRYAAANCLVYYTSKLQVENKQLLISLFLERSPTPKHVKNPTKGNLSGNN